MQCVRGDTIMLLSNLFCNLSNIRYAESPVEEDGTDDSGGNADLDAEPGAKTVIKLFVRKDAEDCFSVPESQASKKDMTGEILLICTFIY